MHFVDRNWVTQRLQGKTVAIVGSAPTVLENEPGFIDSHDVVVRVNNYKCSLQSGKRTDVHYSFYGSSIRKTADELKADGVWLCMSKCPNSRPIDSPWHVRTGRLNGIDFRYIYESRASFWFCPTYVPSDEDFMDKFNLLRRHVPTTGFSAILDILASAPERLYLTGFDFFTSGMHNVNERWIPGNARDPIGHRPQLEAMWLRDNCRKHPFLFDARIQRLILNGKRR